MAPASVTVTVSTRLIGMRPVQFFVERIAPRLIPLIGGPRTAALMQFAGRWGIWGLLSIAGRTTLYRPAKTLIVTWHDECESIGTYWGNC